MAMVAGMLPIALGLGADASFRQPLAVAAIGGFLSSTALRLLVVSIVYTYVDDFERWMRHSLSPRVANSARRRQISLGPSRDHPAECRST